MNSEEEMDFANDNEEELEEDAGIDAITQLLNAQNMTGKDLEKIIMKHQN